MQCFLAHIGVLFVCPCIFSASSVSICKFCRTQHEEIEDLPGDISGYIAESIATVIHEKERGNGMCSCGERIEVKEKAGLVAMSESGGMRE